MRLFEEGGVLAWELLPFCVLRIPICPAENSARQIGGGLERAYSGGLVMSGGNGTGLSFGEVWREAASNELLIGGVRTRR
jgi:hypothetical protein